VLAYVFWHRPGDGVDVADYEARLRAFHETLEVDSAAYRLRHLPWREEGGYEDWYLVEDWTALGELNEAAVAAARKGEHDAAARLSTHGWAGIWRLVRGAAEPPAGVRWQPGPPDDDTAPFWQRQMTLGPAPEFCLVEAAPGADRERVV
jgi:hypothetical protein